MIGYYAVMKFLEFCIKYFMIKKGMCDEAMVAVAILDALEVGSEVCEAEADDASNVAEILFDYCNFKSKYSEVDWKTILEYALMILDIKHGLNNDYDDEYASRYESIWNDALDNAVTDLNSKGFEVCTVSLPNGYVVMYHVMPNAFKQGKTDWDYALIELASSFEMFVEMYGAKIPKEFLKKFWNTKGGCFRKGFWDNAPLRKQVWETFFTTENYVVSLQ